MFQVLTAPVIAKSASSPITRFNRNRGSQHWLRNHSGYCSLQTTLDIAVFHHSQNLLTIVAVEFGKGDNSFRRMFCTAFIVSEVQIDLRLIDASSLRFRIVPYCLNFCCNEYFLDFLSGNLRQNILLRCS